MTFTIEGEKHRPILLSYHRQPVRGQPASSFGLEVSANRAAIYYSWITVIGTSQRHTAKAEPDEELGERELHDESFLFTNCRRKQHCWLVYSCFEDCPMSDVRALAQETS
jgi:hypothetical protein